MENKKDKQSTEHRCPVCNKIVRTSAEKESGEESFFPFCCRRCKLVDLGAWLDAEYKIISGSQSEESAEPDETVDPSAENP
ncbi:MAG: DNA gyrase inhibitor YacG [Planctomycetota bacterium]